MEYQQLLNKLFNECDNIIMCILDACFKQNCDCKLKDWITLNNYDLEIDMNGVMIYLKSGEVLGYIYRHEKDLLKDSDVLAVLDEYKDYLTLNLFNKLPEKKSKKNIVKI